MVKVLEGKMQYKWRHSWTPCLGPHSISPSPTRVGRAGRGKCGSLCRLKGVGWTGILRDWLGIAMETLATRKNDDNN